MSTLLNSRRFRNVAIQAGFVVIILVVVVSAVIIGRQNLQAQGATSGFAFLHRATGFELGFSLIETGPFDSFGRFLLAGLLNTIFLGMIGIVLANVVGLTVAVLRTANNGALNAIGTMYIETFRNIPMILQALFWYALLTSLPAPKQAYHLLDLAFFSSRGLYLPGLNVTGAAAAIFFLLLAAGVVASVCFSISRRFKRMPNVRRSRIRWTVLAAGVLLGIVALAYGRVPDTPVLSIPELRGLNIRDGVRIPPELASLAIAMAVYGGAFIAEVIRAGFISVGKGQVEAAHALGLAPWHVFSRVRLPLAIRAVLPTLINQYVWLFKATTLGIAVGFADFFAVVSVSISQAGQTLELIGILMLGFLVMNNIIAFVLNRVNKAIALKGTQLRV